jgi:DNA-binding CsgD family transcriptional regulator
MKEQNTHIKANILPFNGGIQLLPRQDDRYSSILELPFHVYFVDTASRIVDLNQAILVTGGFTSYQDALGRTAKDVSSKKSAELALQNDQRVIHNRSSLIVDEFFESPELAVRFSVISFKFPWYHTDGKLRGVFGCSIPFGCHESSSLAESLALMQKIGLLNNNNNLQTYYPGKMVNQTYFTKKEIEILKLLTRGYSAAQIAMAVNRSTRTIEGHIANMKAKTNTNKKSDLIEIAFDYI